MTMREFIRNHKSEIDNHIESIVPDFRRSNNEREMWINNDEYLYRLARRNGVRI